MGGDASVTQCHAGVTQLALSSTMTRLSFVAFLALAFSGVALAAPPASQEIVAVDDVHTTAGWSYSICGTCVACSGCNVEPNDFVWRAGDPSDSVIIKSLNISPDPPKPGQQVTVTINAYTSEVIEVRPSGVGL